MKILLAALFAPFALLSSRAAEKPNIVLIMCDDLGWGDVGFNGGTKIKTPHLDEMASQSLVFTRFYAASAVCSPTRASVITGRNPLRQGIPNANAGFLKPEEFTLYEAVKPLGYRTGHFGKWHLGTLSTRTKDANRGGPGSEKIYSPPWDHGVDATFATESKVPTYDPMIKPAGGEGKKGNKRDKADKADDFRSASGDGWYPVPEGAPSAPYGTHYWIAEETMADPESLRGDDSKLIMDRALPFIGESVKAGRPFLAIIWFHAPHLPVVAGPDHTGLYPAVSGFEANYQGCVTALDAQVGRLRTTLRELGVAENTIVTFCSDNGPEGNASAPGSAAGFTGRKRSLHEGGIRVPGILEWPAQIKAGRTTDFPAVTSDYFPTLMEITGFDLPDARPLDGQSLLPVILGESPERAAPIGFLYGAQQAFSDNRYKLYRAKPGTPWSLYDLLADPSEKSDLAQEKPETVQSLAKRFEAWHESVKASSSGADYR